ncbi:hypothetical protein [Actinomycetospora cinnamomea]|uniref:Uncharacterized protein n=1 Tax=Actinomycetospora cinnamomea TaxID=663609 RepID=A0A2U1FRX9_9PSEU|nr:hypothetical protein [Actinomycetospora cinnamomea]PVZ14914.1 hypothetical protein C8D89_101782 [Actinomycetospora cinnamomea]
MASNAWERAQEAIAHASQRATERDEDVITPDTAVSPFDASMTTVLPHATASGYRGGTDPDLTQRLPQDGRRPANGHHRTPPDGPDGQDPATVRLGAQRGPAHPGTSPFPASPFPADEARPEDGRDGRDDTPAPRRSWWRRLFGR